MKKIVLLIGIIILIGGVVSLFLITKNSYKYSVKENKELTNEIAKLKKEIDLKKNSNIKHSNEIKDLTEKYKEELKEQTIWRKTKENLEKEL